MTTPTLTEHAQKKVNALADDQADSTDSDVRYMAYASRLRTALRASTRYIAYTSDVGEAFRPVVSPRVVAAAYGVSWAYLVGDVSYESYKAYRQGPSPLEAANFSEPTRVGLVAVQRGVFQAVASMGLPALTIHTVVRQTAKIYARNAKSVRVKTWGPTLTGLAVVPLLPYLFDEPVEHATDFAFDWMKKRWSETGSQKQ
ncbi:mitochondrial 18 KDa protein-domain-containing protein [Gautieria morchelliformis]|nr:mitochondrial 18 KDa protein-domain-containing protein [Gautieria morchelliformis]